MKVTKNDLAREVRRITNADNLPMCEQIIEAYIDCIKEHLKMGDSIDIRLFGTFDTKTLAAREGVHPKTKEKCIFPESTIVKFKPKKYFKDELNGRCSNDGEEDI